jgi:hypothetical protein
MKDIKLTVTDIKRGKIFIDQNNNGTIKMQGSARSEFLQDLKKGDVVKVSVSKIAPKKSSKIITSKSKRRR